MIILPAAILISWELLGLLRGPKKGAQAARVLALTLALFGATQVAFASPIPANSTNAYFVDRATASVQIHTGFWEYLSVAAGKAKAERHDRSPAAQPIASVDADSKLRLDFGEVSAGNSNNSPDVFTIKNVSSSPLTVTVSASGDFAGFVDSIKVGKGGATRQLEVDERQSVTINIKVPDDTPAGDYTGTVTVSAGEDSTPIRIPVVITVLGGAGENGATSGTTVGGQMSGAPNSEAPAPTLEPETTTTSGAPTLTSDPTTLDTSQAPENSTSTTATDAGTTDSGATTTTGTTTTTAEVSTTPTGTTTSTAATSTTSTTAPAATSSTTSDDPTGASY
jgi:hypothetical protein